ncbi:MAG: deoxyribonuclease V [Thermoprotei archaeon]|nr:deoxyribonuclease V [Thermoprotei archaeon]
MRIYGREVKVPSGFSLERARSVQRWLASKVIERDELPSEIKIVVGCDVAYRGDFAYAAAVALDFKSLTVIRYTIKRVRVFFPYIPTLLSFREAGPVIRAIRALKLRPDVLFIDGQGRAHPYRLGIASHIGVVLDVPTIGVAKKKLCGIIGEFNGDCAPLLDKGEIIGVALITKRGCKPIFVSVGHKISLRTAAELVLRTCRGYKLPEPIRMAHILATREARRHAKG